MKEKSDSLSVPYNFARCFNAQCPQASKCLRYIAAQNEPADYLYIFSFNIFVLKLFKLKNFTLKQITMAIIKIGELSKLRGLDTNKRNRK